MCPASWRPHQQKHHCWSPGWARAVPVAGQVGRHHPQGSVCSFPCPPLEHSPVSPLQEGWAFGQEPAWGVCNVGMGIEPPGKPGVQSFRAGLPAQDRQVPGGLCPGQTWGGKHKGLRGRGRAAPAATTVVPKERGQMPPPALVQGKLWGQSWPRIATGKALP